MDYLSSFAISAAGMAAERTRVEVASLNLAHAHTVQQGANAYQPLRAVVRATGFASLVAPDGPVVAVEPAGSRPRLVHEPGHPAADERGWVAYPGVDPAAEMLTLMTALRAYEANVAAMNTARVLALKALDIGRGA
jgi:flagellar basal-body rod protein FlgC